MTETDLQNLIRIKLSEMGWTVFRCNVGKLRLPDGRFFDTGLPKGHTDLVCYKQGKTAFIEVKQGNNKPSKEQKHFIKTMQDKGFAAGAVWSVDDAVKLVEAISDC